MSKIDDYRVVAAEYDLLAARVASEEAKGELQHIARALRSLADKFDRHLGGSLRIDLR